MLKVETIEVMGIRGALKGMRNPMNSWTKSDSHDSVIGPGDMKLCKALIKAGSSDRKFLRMIHVQADVVAPLYFWKEAETYKVATATNSCSTMHKIHSKPFELDDFSHEHLLPVPLNVLKGVIAELEDFRKFFIESKDKTFWWQMIQLLPSSYNQLRTIDFNYETLMSIWFQRHNHKLDEWHTFCDWILTLPYMEEFITCQTAQDQ